MFRRISPSALAMLLVVALTLTAAVVFDAGERPPADRGVLVAQAPDDATRAEPAPEIASPPAATPRPEPPDPPTRADVPTGGSARPVLAAAPDTVRDIGPDLVGFDVGTFELAPFEFELAPFDLGSPAAASSGGSPSSGDVEPDPAATPTPTVPTPAPTPSAVGPDARELVYPVGAAGEVAVAYDPRGIVEIIEVRPGPGWEVRNRAGWKKGVKVLFGSLTEPVSEATIYVQIVERQPVVTVTLPDPMPAS